MTALATSTPCSASASGCGAPQSSGGLIVVWIAVDIKNLGWVNKIAMAALFILSIVLCVVVFRGNTPVTVPDDSLSFGAAVELAG